MAIIAEEQQKHNNALARELLLMLEASRPKRGAAFEKAPTPKDAEPTMHLAEPRVPHRRLTDIVLSERGFNQIHRVIEEYRRGELLRAHGLRPKTKLLFCGPPGCGKTLCAEVLASELKLPLLYARFDAIVSSYLGETSANLRRIFEVGKARPWVVLLDEFDAIGKSRNDLTEHGELKRVVNSFLQLLDSYTGDSIFVAATNHERLLDDALWRRFDEIIGFPKPTTSDIEKLIVHKLRNFAVRDVAPARLAQALKGLSHADIEWICLDAVKTAILNNMDAVGPAIIQASIVRQRDRQTIRAKP